MSDTVYAIASGKGGVGKTTTAINLGAMLADRGHSVIVVDTDLGMANLADFLDFEIETPTLHEVLAGEADPDDAIYGAPGDIDVLPSATDIEAFVKSDPANLRSVIEDLREKYDYVLLDTGSGVSYDTLVPLALADSVLLVATPDVASVRDTTKTGELAERVETEVRGAVLAQRSSDILNADDVKETLGTEVLAVIPRDEAVPMGIDAGRPLAAFAPNAPAGQAYRSLAAVLTGDAEPDPELETSDDEETESETAPRNDSADHAGTPESATSASDAEVAVSEMPTEDKATGAKTASAEATDDPLSADAAQNVRDAISDESGGDIDSLFAGGESDETPGSTDEKTGSTDEVPEENETAADSDSEESGSASDSDGASNSGGANDSDGASDPRDKSNADGVSDLSGTSDLGDTSDARSVDDLINEHISDERLDNDQSLGGNDGGDPLAEMGGGSPNSAESADSTDSEENPFDSEDPFAEGPVSAKETSGDSESDPANEWSQDDTGTVPFENRKRGSSADNSEQESSESVTGDSSEEDDDIAERSREPPETKTELSEETEKLSEESEELSKRNKKFSEDSSESAEPDADSSEDEKPSEDGGVLGRLGSIFR